MHETPGLKLDCLGEIKLLSLKNLISSLNISFSKILPEIGKSETGR